MAIAAAAAFPPRQRKAHVNFQSSQQTLVNCSTRVGTPPQTSTPREHVGNITTELSLPNADFVATDDNECREDNVDRAIAAKSWRRIRRGDPESLLLERKLVRKKHLHVCF